jgi:hypothetical protein
MYDHHNPSLSLPLMNELLSSLVGWTDTTFGDDCCASIAKDELQLFLPNSLRNNADTEETADFQLYNDDKGEFFKFSSVESVLTFINAL